MKSVRAEVRAVIGKECDASVDWVLAEEVTSLNGCASVITLGVVRRRMASHKEFYSHSVGKCEALSESLYSQNAVFSILKKLFISKVDCYHMFAVCMNVSVALIRTRY